LIKRHPPTEPFALALAGELLQALKVQAFAPLVALPAHAASDELAGFALPPSAQGLPSASSLPPGLQACLSLLLLMPGQPGSAQMQMQPGN
jgi:hypothetical protein